MIAIWLLLLLFLGNKLTQGSNFPLFPVCLFTCAIIIIIIGACCILCKQSLRVASVEQHDSSAGLEV